MTRERVTWWKWLAMSLLAGAATFGLGYAVAVFLIFPPRATARGGTPVPRIIGLDVTAATRELSRVGLLLGDTIMLPSPIEPAGIVVAQSPLPEQQLARGAHVRIGVSSGSARAMLPDVTGVQDARAVALLSSLGFQVTQRPEQSDQTPGRVIRMDPPPGVEYTLPASVTIVVTVAPPVVVDSTALDTLAVPAGPVTTATPVPQQ